MLYYTLSLLLNYKEKRYTQGHEKELLCYCACITDLFSLMSIHLSVIAK